MLILSRRKDELIRIGDDCLIQIIEIKDETVRLGIIAPDAISVHREEVYKAIQADGGIRRDAGLPG